jgi:hypothetical protein
MIRVNEKSIKPGKMGVFSWHSPDKAEKSTLPAGQSGGERCS